MKRILTTILLSALLMLPWAHTAFAADQTIAYTEEMVGSGHPTKADTLNRHGLVEHNTDGTHQKPISHLTASRGVVTDADKKLASDEAATGTGSPVRANTPTLVTPVIGAATGTSLAVTGDLKTNTTGTIDVAAGKTVNIDDDVTISAEFHVEAATHVNQDLTSDASPIFATVKLSGLTDGYLPYHVNDATGLADSILKQSSTSLLQIGGNASKLYWAGNAGGEGIVMNVGGTNFVGLQSFYTGATSRISLGYTAAAATNITEVLSVLESGNVGIGTTSPDYKLDVAGTMGIDQYLYHNGDTDTFLNFEDDRVRVQVGAEYLLDLYEGAQDYVKLGDGGDVDINLNDDVFVEGSSGNVGIGTTGPSGSLDITSSSPQIYIRKSNASTNHGLWRFGAETEGTFNLLSLNDAINSSYAVFTATRDSTNGIAKVVFPNGNVGIGTTTFIDDEKLRVNGDIYSDGDVSALTFTDRTPFYEGDALSAILNIKGKDGEIDHSTLPTFARKTVKKNIYTSLPLSEVSSDDAFETVSVEQDKIVVDENGKKSRVISGTISSGYEVKDGQVVENFVPVYEKETVKKTQLKKNIHVDSATGKLYRTTGGEVFEKDGILYERILSGQEDQERRDLGAMISILTVAIQQQQAQIELLKARVTALENK